MALIEIVKGIDYIFTLDELEEMFNEAGLKTKDVISAHQAKKKFTLGDGRVYIVASKIYLIKIAKIVREIICCLRLLFIERVSRMCFRWSARVNK